MTAVYSRCRVEPVYGRVSEAISSNVPSAAAPNPAYAAGRGCDIYRYDFATARETKLTGASTSQASETLPSIWKGTLAFVRVYEQRSGARGRVPYLYTKPVSGGASRRQPGGTRGVYGLPGPTSLDLYGHNLSFTWDYATGSRFSAKLMTELRVDRTDSHRHRALGQHAGGAYLSPTGSRGRIYYGYQRVDGGSDQRGGFFSKSRLRLTYDLASERKTVSAQVPGQLLVSVAVDGNTIIYGTSNDNWGTDTPARVLRDRLP